MKLLAKQTKVQFTHDIEKALFILENNGVCKTKFIRQAVEEKLYKDFRKILKEIDEEKKKEYCPF